MAGRLAGKVAVITGAGSGIGRATTQLFCAEGAKVVAVDRNEEGLRETVDALKGAAVAHAADVGREADVQGYLARAEKEFGGLDIVYANAGVSGGLVSLLDVSVEMFSTLR